MVDPDDMRSHCHVEGRRDEGGVLQVNVANCAANTRCHGGFLAWYQRRAEERIVDQIGIDNLRVNYWIGDSQYREYRDDDVNVLGLHI